MNLDGTTCLVTGANRGIGRALAAELATRPVRLLAGVRSLDRWEPLEVPGARMREEKPVRLELSSRAALDGCMAEIGADWKSLHASTPRVTSPQLQRVWSVGDGQSSCPSMSTLARPL